MRKALIDLDMGVLSRWQAKAWVGLDIGKAGIGCVLSIETHCTTILYMHTYVVFRAYCGTFGALGHFLSSGLGHG